MDDWLKDLHCLAVRFEGLGIAPEFAALSLVELWGMYRFLLRIAEG